MIAVLPDASAAKPLYVMLVCQHGAEGAIKSAMAEQYPQSRFAFSRPGFLTFRIAEDEDAAPAFEPPPPLVRAWAYSIGRADGAGDEERAAAVWELAKGYDIDCVHVFARDRAMVGDRGFEPGRDKHVAGVIAALKASNPCPKESPESLRETTPTPPPEKPEDNAPGREGDEHRRIIRFGPALRNQVALDICLVEPDQWWVGVHEARSRAERWPGGVPRLTPPADMVSRAWLKMSEAIAWSGFLMKDGARVIDVGSAPGGASQAILERACEVIGIDPALPDESVLSHSNYKHIRARARYAPHRELRKARWLVCDMNTAPTNTLDVVEDIVTAKDMAIRGALITLKLPSYDLLGEMPGWLDRVRGWGFNMVKARQLAFNRQEICVSGLKRPFRR